MPTRYSLTLAAIAVALCATTGTAHSADAPADHYRQVRTMLFSGVPTVAIFSPSRCRNGQPPSAATATPVVSGGAWIRAFLELNGHTIAFSNEHFTVKPDGSPVLELIQYRVALDRDATVTVRSLSPTTYMPVAEPRVFQCALGDGLRFVPASTVTQAVFQTGATSTMKFAPLHRFGLGRAFFDSNPFALAIC